MPRGRKPKNQTVNTVVNTDNENNENINETEESKEIIRYAGETSINHVSGKDFCIFYAGERKWYNWVLQMLKEHPDEITIIKHYEKQDKSIEVKIPYAIMGYLRWPTKRTMTDEQREAARDRMKKAREARKINEKS